MEDTPTTIEHGTPWSTGTRVVAGVLAAVAIAVLVVFAIVSLRGSDESDAVAEARSVTGRYFAAVNAGDADAALALLTADVTFTERYGPGGGPNDLDPELELALFTAQGAVFRSSSCTVAADQPSVGTMLSCDYETLDSLTQAVDALPVPTTTRFTVASGAISEVDQTYAPQPGQPDFVHVGRPFQRWMATNRPEVTCLAWYVSSASCERPGTAEETTEVWRMVAQYAQEWAAHLQENGCGYLDGC